MRRTAIFFVVCLLFFCLVTFFAFSRTNGNSVKDNKKSEGMIEISTAPASELTKNREKQPIASELVACINGSCATELSVLLNRTEANVIKTPTVLVNASNERLRAEEILVKEQQKEPKLLENHLKRNITSGATTVVDKQNPTPSSHSVDKLKGEIQRAEEELSVKIKRLEDVKKRANTSHILSEKANDHMKSLIFALNNLQGSLIQSSKAAFETDLQLQLQTAMYNEAKAKYMRLSRELEMTVSDYEKTKMATENAIAAANIARQNVMSKPISLNLNQ